MTKRIRADQANVLNPPSSFLSVLSASFTVLSLPRAYFRRSSPRAYVLHRKTASSPTTRSGTAKTPAYRSNRMERHSHPPTQPDPQHEAIHWPAQKSSPPALLLLQTCILLGN